ncbi:MAG TPA: hypothetical protein VF407_14170, partial [Polyangiaceae bacterium]
MPTYDPFEQRMAVRVVYDGAAWAGKTTNVKQLCTLFAAQRSSDLFSPAEMNGRTLYFDWLQISAGVVCGFPLLCQVVSAPGQVVLAPRRRQLLRSADVVVHVVGSGPNAIEEAKRGLALLDEIAKERGAPLPLVVQANKQDRPDATDGKSLLALLGREESAVVEAIASDGVGVVDTFVTAIRTVARALQSRSEERSLHVHVRRAETADETLAHLAEEPIDPEWAAEMLLEEAQSLLLQEEERARLASDATAHLVAREAVAEIEAWGDTVPPPSEPPTVRPARRTAPPLPSPDVPTGFIWPAHTGRAVVRSLALGVVAAHEIDAEGNVHHVAHDHVVKTSARARYAAREPARQALVRAARECAQLDGLLVPETVLVAQPADDGTCWIWTVRPNLPTLAQSLRSAGSTELVTAFADALAEATRVSLRHGLALDFSPHAFGVDRGVLRYLGETELAPPNAERLAAAMHDAFEGVERCGADVSL